MKCCQEVVASCHERSVVSEYSANSCWFQIVSGRRAGAYTILLDTDHRYADPSAQLPPDMQPDALARSLTELQEQLSQML